MYRSAIEKLRKSKTADAPQDTPGHEYIAPAPRSALLYESERIDVDEWLVDDLPRNSLKRSHDLYNCGSLPKKHRLAPHSFSRPDRVRSKQGEHSKTNSRPAASSDL